MNPDIIVLGEASCDDLSYEGYAEYNTITQNSAGDIIFECTGRKVHIYVSNVEYTVDYLDDENMNSYDYYLGTLNF